MKATYSSAKIILIIIVICFSASCKKFLDEKPDKTLAVPANLEDVQAMLDNYRYLNGQSPNMGAMSDDDFYLTDAYYQSLVANFRDLYVWKREALADEGWAGGYSTVLYANLSLETLREIPVTPYNKTAYDLAFGSALFFRSFAFYNLAQHYSKPYDAAQAANLPGISLREETDVNARVTRSTMQETYAKIIADAKASLALLPARSVPASRPSKAAAFALLSNVFLTMGNYPSAGLYADSALQVSNSLINYNGVSATAAIPFDRFNAEVIFSAYMQGASRFAVTRQRVDSTLYNSYNINDYRKRTYYKVNGTATEFGFKGNYAGNTFGEYFNGFAVDELYFIKAECAARAGNTVLAMQTLNAVLITRWKTNTYVPFTASTPQQALAIILTERRKELVGRGRRWYDLRRLNTDPLFAKTLTRKISGEIITLPPNDPRYTFYIPQKTITETGIQQNER